MNPFDLLRRRAEAAPRSAARQTEDTFRVLAQITAEAVLVFQDDLIRYANPAAAITGYRRQELTLDREGATERARAWLARQAPG